MQGLRRFLSILICLAAAPVVAEGQEVGSIEGPFYVHTGLGYTSGIAPSQDIHKFEVRLGFEQVFHPALSGGPELAGVQFSGTRDGQDAHSRGATLAYQLKWHALRYRGASLHVGFGFGGAYFATAFPPGGTRFNGYSFFGLGLVFPLGPRVRLLLDAREMHHSNGRGLVSDNPAFDGLSFNLGIGVRP